MSGQSAHLGSASQPNRRLRSRIVAMLRVHDGLTAWEIAASAYGRRLIVRRGCHRTAPTARLWATRRALRRLVEKGRVVVVGRYRRRKLFAIAGRPPFPPLDLGPPDGS